MSDPSLAERSRLDRLRSTIEHCAHVLPKQGPIGVFVHHNTLHAFEHLPFEYAVKEAAQLFGAEPYMSEASYRAELARGRIRFVDVDAVLDAEPDSNIFVGLSRSSLQRAMITPGVREFDGATIVWRTEQGDLAKDFRRPALRVLFEACFARTVAHEEEPVLPRPVDEVIHPWLIRLCSVFLDQGTAYWPMPNREKGFYESVRMLLSRRGGILPRYLIGLDEEFRKQERRSFSAGDAVLDYLDSRSHRETEWPEVLQAELLALPGWAGLMHKLEEDPTLAPHKILPCSLLDFLAVRLTMSRVAARRGAAEPIPEEPPLKTQERRRLSRTARVYDAARAVRLSAEEVENLSESEWVRFSSEVKTFNGLERRRILHLAYERAHEREILRGLASHRKYRGLFDQPQRPLAQVFFCLDEREESMRRALEEANPSLETYSAAGYFGVAVDYKGIDDSHGAALCPVVVKPEHAVIEQPKPGDSQLLESRRWRRRVLGLLMRSSFVSSKTLLRGWLSTSVLGLLSAVPLIGHLLAPRRYALLRDRLNQAFLPEPRTELALMRNTKQSEGAVSGLLMGFTPEEKAERVASVLGPAGLVRGFAPLVVILGHGSSSLNNPHESAHDCGACGGRRGGPNARLFAAMANRQEVREGLREKGIDIPPDTWFIGGYHDTCSDDVEFFDLDAVPSTHHADLESIRSSLDLARAQNALVGTSGGFTFVLEDRGGHDIPYLAANVDRFMAAARKRPEIAGMTSSLLPSVPQQFVAVDRDKVLKQGVPIADVYATLQAYMGGLFINYFNRFGRQWQVYAEADGNYRANAQDAGQFYVRNNARAMVPLSALTKFEPRLGPEFIMHYDEYPSAQINGSAAPGYSSDQAMAALEQVFAQTMPHDMGYDYMGMSFQQKQAEQGISAAAIFGISILFVFLILAALYESWSLPFSVLLSTPVAVFGAFGVLLLRRWLTQSFYPPYMVQIENDVYSQIGLVMLIGLAAKNAILIVEFAKDEYEKGEPLVEAALGGARLRLRPILMTSLAFILGCAPLWFASGAGSVARKIMGTTVIGGMLAASAIAIFFIPAIFYFVERLSGAKRRHAPQTSGDAFQEGDS